MRRAVLYGQRGVGFEERGMLTAAMTHIAVQEALDGKVVEWLEQVARTIPLRIGGCITGVQIGTFWRRP